MQNTCSKATSKDRIGWSIPYCSVYWSDVDWQRHMNGPGTRSVAEGHAEHLQSIAQDWPMLQGKLLACGCIVPCGK